MEFSSLCHQNTVFFKSVITGSQIMDWFFSISYWFVSVGYYCTWGYQAHVENWPCPLFLQSIWMNIMWNVQYQVVYYTQLPLVVTYSPLWTAKNMFGGIIMEAQNHPKYTYFPKRYKLKQPAFVPIFLWCKALIWANIIPNFGRKQTHHIWCFLWRPWCNSRMKAGHTAGQGNLNINGL